MPVRRAVLIAAVLVGFTTYDEYFPLIAARARACRWNRCRSWSRLTVVGQAVGTALAGRTASLRPRALGAIVLAGAVLISVGALITPYAGFVGIAVGYGLLGNAMVVAEARLQEVISGPARATVTSVYGLATEVVAIAVYASFAAAAGLLSRDPARRAARRPPRAASRGGSHAGCRRRAAGRGASRILLPATSGSSLWAWTSRLQI